MEKFPTTNPIRMIIPILLIGFLSGIGLAFTPTSSNKIVVQEHQHPLVPPGQLALHYNDVEPAHIYYRNFQPTGAEASAWDSVKQVPVEHAIGTNWLRLYDGDSPLRPLNVKEANVGGVGIVVEEGDFRAMVDVDGRVWQWLAANTAEGEDDFAAERHVVAGLPEVTAVALGRGHAVALTYGGEVWVWALRVPEFPTGLSPPEKLAGVPLVRAIGAWREYGMASTGEGELWIWQRGESTLEDLTDEDLLEAIGYLSGGRNAPQEAASASTLSALGASAVTTQSATVPTGATVIAQAGLPPNGLRLWLKADWDYLTNDGVNAVVLTDLSGNNFHAKQVNLSRAPSLEFLPTRFVNTTPTLVFSGPGKHFTIPQIIPDNTPTAEYFIALKAKGLSSGNMFLLTSGLSFFSSVANRYGAIVDSNVGITSAPIPEQATYGHLYNASLGGKLQDSYMRLHGKRIGTAGPRTTNYTWSKTVALGSTSTSTYWEGEIAEVLVYDHVLSIDERASVIAYFNNRFSEPIQVYPPITPAALTVTATEAGTALVSWALPNSDAVEVERASADRDDWVQIYAGEREFYFDEGLVEGMSYRYRHRFRNAINVGGYSNSVTFTMTAPANAGVNPNGLCLWLKADIGAVADVAGHVGSWVDLSGSQQSFVQFDTAAQPEKTDNATPGGYAAVRFNGTSSFLNLSRTLSGKTAEYFVVLRKTPEGSLGQSALSVGHVAGLQYPNTDGKIHDDFGGSAAGKLISTTPASDPGLTNWHIYNASAGGEAQDSVARLDGKLLSATVPAAKGFPSSWFLGKGSAAASFWAGDIAELLVYDHVLSAAEREGIESYLKNKYGFSAPPPPAVPNAPSMTVVHLTRVLVKWEFAQETDTVELQRRTGTDGEWETIYSGAAREMLDENLDPYETYAYRIVVRNMSGRQESAFSSVVLAGSAAHAVPTDGLRLWLNPQSVKNNNGMVSQWLDWSGHNSHLAGTARSATMGDQPTVLFDGTSNQLSYQEPSRDEGDDTNTIVMIKEMERYVVLKAQSGSVTGREAYHLGARGTRRGGVQYPATDGTIRDSIGYLGDDATPETISFPAGKDAYGWHLYHTRSTAESRLAFVDGQLAQAPFSGSTAEFETHEFMLGGVWNISTRAWTYWAGEIAEVLVYDRALSVSEQAAVQRYLAAKYPVLELPPPTQTLSTPQNLRAEANGHTITFRWDPVSAPNVLYELQVRTANGTYETCVKLPHNAVSYTCSVAPKTAYMFRLRTRTLLEISDPSNEVSVMAPGDPLDARWGELPQGGMQLWLKGHVGIATDQDNNVVLWEDQSGQHNHARTVPQDYPVDGRITWEYAADAANKVVRIHGWGPNHLQLPALMANATGGEVFVILKSLDAEGYGMANPFKIDGMHDFNYCMAGRGVYILDNFGRSNSLWSIFYQDVEQNKKWWMYNVSASVVDWRARVNNVQIRRSDGEGVAFGSLPGLIGGNDYYDTGTDIAELIVYNRPLNDAERWRVSNYLNEKYRLGINGLSLGDSDWDENTEISPGGLRVRDAYQFGLDPTTLRGTGGAGAPLPPASDIFTYDNRGWLQTAKQGEGAVRTFSQDAEGNINSAR
jgi:hypothetical protein